jgi:catechol 2,3-dioxygenase-like lactoylglutathione lyase family enzyme/uncharacterized protein (DUF1330 family)
MMKFTGFALALLAGSAVQAQDPLAPRDNASLARASPLASVTVGTADLAMTERFYGDAMAMKCTRSRITGKEAARFRRHYSMAAGQAVETTWCSRPGAASVRAVLLPANTPASRPGYDSRMTGGLSLGFPSADNQALEARVGARGFGSTAGQTSMQLQRGDGTSYTVGEIHFKAPDNVYALGINRGTMPAVGPIEPTVGVGGPAYSGMMVGNMAAAHRLFGDVLGLEARRRTNFKSSGPTGGLGLPAGSSFDFEQWFSPGSTSGYVILMHVVDKGLRPAAPLGLKSRGLGMWTFEARDLADIAARAKAAGVRVVSPAAASPWPGEQGRRSMVLATADGFPVEVIEQSSAMAPRAAIDAPPSSAPVPALDPNRCDNQPVIMVVSGQLKDRARLAAYAKAIRDSGLYDTLGGYYLASPRSVATFEGTVSPDASTLLVRFPCLAHARTFWYSTRYQRDIVPLRMNPSAGDFTVTVHPEVAPPQYMTGRLQPGGYSWRPADDVLQGVPQIADRP